MEERDSTMTTRYDWSVQPGEENTMKIATGFDLEPLPNGNVLIEFFGDDGKTFNKQIVTVSVVNSMPVVATLSGVAMREGVGAVNKIMDAMCDQQEVRHES